MTRMTAQAGHDVNDQLRCGDGTGVDSIILQPIGVIHTPYKNSGDAPRQGRFSDADCILEVYPEFVPGLKYIEKASHLIVLYWGHLANRNKLQTRTPYGETVRGVFATRSPSRPNPIALCMAELLEVNGGRLKVHGLDALDGSFLLDIKPYLPDIDSIPGTRMEMPGK